MKHKNRNYKTTFNCQIIWHRKLRKKVYERDGFKCVYCGYVPDNIPENYNGRYTAGALVLDHITPVASGGTLSEENLQTLCEACNGKKYISKKSAVSNE